MPFESQLIKTDVTAVKLLENFILAGIGNCLNVYARNDTLEFINKIKVFDGQKIHGIKVDALNSRILTYGGCHMKVLTFNIDTAHCVQVRLKKINDWILTAKWLNNKNVAVVVMLNKVITYDENFSKQREILCDEKCILYSAYLHYGQDELVVFSGTVFGEILIWKVSPHQPDPNGAVLAKLKGHKGVIFSVHYNTKNGYICSSSDDRSTILWFVASKCIHTELQQSAPNIILKQKVYGHQSRVFRSELLDELLVTAGEDSYINVWNLEGTLVRAIHTHQGSPVWAIDCTNDVIASGGGDCGVLLSPIHPRLLHEQLTIPHNEVARRVAVLHSKNLVVVSESGFIFHYVQAMKQWVTVAHHEDLKGYNLLEVSKCRNLLSLSGYKGTIYIYKERNNVIERSAECVTTTKSRIFSFHWLSCQTFFTCENDGLMTLWYLHQCQGIQICTFLLPEIKDVWSTAACQASGRYIVGDRKGNIYVYVLQSRTPIQTIKKAHSYQGITQLYHFDGKILSLGRNGIVRTFSIDKGQMAPASKDKVPFSWLARIIHRWLLAFSGNNFLVWDYEARRSLFEHNCGGGHRSWDFLKADVMMFVYIKDHAVNLINYEERTVSPVNIVSGYHHKTINSVKIVRVSRSYMLLSGSEDTNLRLGLINEDGFHTLRNLKSHLSSIRSLCIHHAKDGEYLAFSGGGRGQIVCWKIVIDLDNVYNTECMEYYSYYELLSNEMSEIRIMDLCVVKQQQELILFAACSDGNIKVFIANREIDLVRNLFHNLKCITRICIIDINVWQILIAMSTDGNLTFWDVTAVVQRETIIPIQTMKVHQSGINSCSAKLLDDNLLALLTGGDDGNISLILFKICANELGRVELTRLSKFRNDKSHCAQITGTFITQKYFVTCSVDQKLLIFTWNIVDNKLHCSLLSRYNSAIEDIQGVECHENDECVSIFLYGKGLEYVKWIRPVLG